VPTPHSPRPRPVDPHLLQHRAHDLADWATAHTHTGWLWVEAHKLPIDAGLGVTVAAAGCWWLAGRRGGKAKAPNNERVLTMRLAPLLGYPIPKNSDKAPEKFLTFTRHGHGRRRAYSKVEARFPERKTPSQKELDECGFLVGAHLGGEWVYTYRDAFRSSRVVYTPKYVPQLPARVKYTDDPELPLEQIPIGIGDTGHSTETVTAELSPEVPHVLIAGPTRSGKTATVSMFIAHAASRGALVYVIDPKRAGFVTAFRGLPNVRIAVDEQPMIDMISTVRGDMDRRYVDEADGANLADRDRYPALLLVVDELGMFMAMMDDHHRATRGPGVGPVPPAIAALKAILWKGGHAAVHVLYCAHQPNAELVGTDQRAQFAVRIATKRPDQQSAQMLFGRAQLPDIPNPSIKGRGIVQLDGEAPQVTQLAFLDPERAREIATRGTVTFDSYRAAQNVDSNVDGAPSASETPDPDVPDSPSTVDSVPVPMQCRACRQRWAEPDSNRGKVVKCKDAGCRRSRRVPVAGDGLLTDDAA
jgi:hypothetical protein